MTLEHPMFPPRRARTVAAGAVAEIDRAKPPARVRRAPAPPVRPLVDVDAFPREYGLTLEGGCLEPIIPDGAAIVMDKLQRPMAGDFACIWWRPELIRPGMYQGWVKRLTTNIPPFVKAFPFEDHPESEIAATLVCEQLSPAKGYAVRCNTVHAVHKVVGYMPPECIAKGRARGVLLPIPAE